MNETPFVQEISDQPRALLQLAKYYNSNQGRNILRGVKEAVSEASRVVFTGMGTSFFAPMSIQGRLDELGLLVENRDAAEFLHFGLRGLSGSELVIAVSQSGESIETRSVVEELQGKVKLVSVVNDESSFIGKHSDIICPIHAGVEASISTKSYTNTLGLLMLLAAAIRGGNLSREVDRLEQVAATLASELPKSRARAVEVIDHYGNLTNLHVIARGTDLVSAHQLALIIKEGAGVFSEALSAGSFRHGPIELAGEGHNALFLTSEPNFAGLTVNLAEEIAGYGSRVIIVSDKERSQRDGTLPIQEITLEMGGAPSRFFSLLNAPFLEFLVHQSANIRHREAGVFRRTRKITTKE